MTKAFGGVALLARDIAELRRAHDELVQPGADVGIVPCELLERAQIEDAVRKVVAHFGGIDGLISLTPAWLTWFSDRAIARNNESRGNVSSSQGEQAPR